LIYRFGRPVAYLPLTPQVPSISSCDLRRELTWSKQSLVLSNCACFVSVVTQSGMFAIPVYLGRVLINPLRFTPESGHC
jgi:hypothetical protein